MKGVFVRYELASGCRRSDIYMIWSLEEFAQIYGSTKSLSMFEEAEDTTQYNSC